MCFIGQGGQHGCPATLALLACQEDNLTKFARPPSPCRLAKLLENLSKTSIWPWQKKSDSDLLT